MLMSMIRSRSMAFIFSDNMRQLPLMAEAFAVVEVLNAKK